MIKTAWAEDRATLGSDLSAGPGAANAGEGGGGSPPLLRLLPAVQHKGDKPKGAHGERVGHQHMHVPCVLMPYDGDAADSLLTFNGVSSCC